MTDRCETFRDCRTTIPLSFLKVSNRYTIACSFYGSPNEQNRMSELCTFSQIWSHIYLATCQCDIATQLQYFNSDWLVTIWLAGAKLQW